MLKKVSIIISVVIGLCAITTFGYKYDQRLAKADDLKQTNIRLEQKIQSDRVAIFQERIWKYEDRYGTDCAIMPVNIRDEYRHLLKNKEDAITILEGLKIKKK